MNLLDKIDALPVLIDMTGCYIASPYSAVQPWSRRQHEEEEKRDAKECGEDWVTCKENPAFEINGKGQRRTKDYKPPEPPETDIPVPCVVDGFAVPALSFQPCAYGLTKYFPTSPEEKPLPTKFETDVALGLLVSPCAHHRAEAKETLARFPDGWIPHKPGDPMPCDPDMYVEAKLRNGEILGGSRAQIWAWHSMPELAGREIIAWKPA